MSGRPGPAAHRSVGHARDLGGWVYERIAVVAKPTGRIGSTRRRSVDANLEWRRYGGAEGASVQSEGSGEILVRCVDVMRRDVKSEEPSAASRGSRLTCARRSG